MTEENPRKPSDAISWETRKGVEISIKIGDLKKQSWCYRSRHNHATVSRNIEFRNWKLTDSGLEFLARVSGEDEEVFYHYQREWPSKIDVAHTKYHVVEDRHFSSTFHIVFKKLHPDRETDDRWQTVFADPAARS